jgi:hypothetical protein
MEAVGTVEYAFATGSEHSHTLRSGHKLWVLVAHPLALNYGLKWDSRQDQAVPRQCVISAVRLYVIFCAIQRGPPRVPLLRQTRLYSWLHIPGHLAFFSHSFVIVLRSN